MSNSQKIFIILEFWTLFIWSYSQFFWSFLDRIIFFIPFYFRSAPDIASFQVNPAPVEKKGHSQPRSKSEKASTQSQAKKAQHPSKPPSQLAPGFLDGSSSDSSLSTNASSSSKLSPLDKSKQLDSIGKTLAASGSPKPKRTIFEGFKQTLMPFKGKSHDGASRTSSKDSGGIVSPSNEVMPDLFPSGVGSSSANGSRSNSEDNSPVS